MCFSNLKHDIARRKLERVLKLLTNLRCENLAILHWNKAIIGTKKK